MIRKSLLILSIVGLASSMSAYIASNYWVAYCTPFGFEVWLRDGHLVRQPNALNLSGWVHYGSGGNQDPKLRNFGMVDYAARKYPLWVPILAFAMCPLLVCGWSARQRNVRRLRGNCAKCGYDLRGSTDTCPECGRTMETAK